MKGSGVRLYFSLNDEEGHGATGVMLSGFWQWVELSAFLGTEKVMRLNSSCQ